MTIVGILMIHTKLVSHCSSKVENYGLLLALHLDKKLAVEAALSGGLWPIRNKLVTFWLFCVDFSFKFTRLFCPGHFLKSFFFYYILNLQ